MTQRPSHHATGGVRVRRLRDGDERERVLALQAFEFNVVEQIACRAVNLVEQQPVEFDGVLLCICDQFAERFAFVCLARGLSDAKELHDLAAG